MDLENVSPSNNLQKLDVVLNVNKPIGWTSNDVIRRLKLGKVKYKIGHAGTLDPFADGVLVICAGKATKRVPELMEQVKEYQAIFELGTQTDTLDIAGKIEKQADVPQLTPELLHELQIHFNGEMMQTPPVFSALRVNGRRSYERARDGEDVKPKERKIIIYNMQVELLPQNRLLIIVSCSKGTYIRALARDMAAFLGTVGYVRKLTRTRVGDHQLDKALDITSAADFLRTQI